MKLNKETNRISLSVNNLEIGEITFYEEGSILVVDHTYVNPDYRGNNYARILVDEVIKLAREKELKINPVCPYVEKVLKRDEKYRDILA